MYPIAACRPKSPGNLEVSLLGNVIGVGEKTWTEANGNVNKCYQTFAAVTGTICNIRIKLSGSSNIRVAIYSDNAGAPGTILAQSGSVACVAGWNVIPIAATALSAGNYWLASQSLTTNVVLRNADAGSFAYNASPYSVFSDDPAVSTGSKQMAIAGWGWAT